MAGKVRIRINRLRTRIRSKRRAKKTRGRFKGVKRTYKRFRQPINYMLFGLGTTLVSLVSFYLLMLLPWYSSDNTTIFGKPAGYLAANFFAYIIAMVFSYVVNRNFVFGNKVCGKRAIIIQFYLFLGTRIAALCVEETLLFLAVDKVGISKYIAKWPVAVLMVLVNYPLGKFVVFRARTKPESAEET